MAEPVRVIPLERLRMRDLAQVGGKNASLGEMIGELSAAGIRVPGGFATTSDAFREFMQHNGLASRIEDAMKDLDVAVREAMVGAIGDRAVVVDRGENHRNGVSYVLQAIDI